MVADCARGEKPGKLAPGQAEACPHTAAIERHCGHKKSACNGLGALLRQLDMRVLTPGHGIDRDERRVAPAAGACNTRFQVDDVYSLGYALPMFTFKQSDEFRQWLAGLKDVQGKVRVLSRIRNAEQGHFGDCEPVGEGVSEMRIHVGPGYRLYFPRRGPVVYFLLIGGDKSSQKRDIKRAREMAQALPQED